MGHAIEQIALRRGHEIVACCDKGWSKLPSCDVAIEFTSPTSAKKNVFDLLSLGIPTVSGSTGWLDEDVKEELTQFVKEKKGSFFYASNFSVGVYLTRRAIKAVASQLEHLQRTSEDKEKRQYNVRMEEVHHLHKADYPSGTALTMADDILASLSSKERVVSHLEPKELSPLSASSLKTTDLEIACFREKEVPGIHRVFFESTEDVIRIEHEAFGRDGFAFGAVLAAEFIVDKTGFLGMDDLLGNN